MCNRTAKWLGKNWDTYGKVGVQGIQTFKVPIPQSELEDVLQEIALEFIEVDALRFYLEADGSMKDKVYPSKFGRFVARKAIKLMQRAGQDFLTRSTLQAKTYLETKNGQENHLPESKPSHHNPHFATDCRLDLKAICEQTFENSDEALNLYQRRIDGGTYKELAEDLGDTRRGFIDRYAHMKDVVREAFPEYVLS